MTPEEASFLDTLRDKFLLRAAQDLCALKAGGEDAAELGRRVHRLSGSAGVFGFAEVSSAAAVVDDARAAGEPPEPGALEALISALERLPRPA